VEADKDMYMWAAIPFDRGTVRLNVISYGLSTVAVY